MPYEMRQSAKGYCVHKQGDSGPALGCHKSKSAARRQVKALYASESETMKEHTGVMIALPVPERYHEMLVNLQASLPRGTERVPVEEAHVTLLYLGDSSEIEPLKARIYASSLNAIEWQDGIPAKLTGLARFNGDENGKNPLVLLVDSPLLPGFRQRLFSHLTERGVPDNQRHGFIPHITLGYIPTDAKTPQLEVPQEQIVFDSLAVAWGDETLIVPLSGDAAYKAEGKGYGARAGETIRGNLIRGGDGKFGSAGDSTEAVPADEKKPTVRNQRLGRTAAAREAAKLQARESKKRTTAAESEKKRQARRAETEKRREQNKRVREAKRADDKKKKLDESERKLQENRQKTLEKTPLNQEAYDSLLAFSEARDGEFDPRMIEAIAKETGLIAIGNDGTFRMSPEAKALLKALDKGDARVAMDAISRAGDKLDKAEARQAKDASEKEAGLSVFKDANGRYRWLLLSSNAYRDRDGEIVSTKALAQDVARADSDKDYGPLRWWHVPGLDIGDCDFNALSGRVLVESGTFRSEALGEAVFKSQDSLQASIGFRHPTNEPDHERVYHNIRRFERSLTPTGRASNPFTQLIVKQGGTMEDEKIQEFKARFGRAGEEALEEVLGRIQATEKAADAAGTAFKEAPESSITLERVETAAAGNNGGGNFTMNAQDVARVITTPAPEGPVAPATSLREEANEEDEQGEELIYAGDMPPHDLANLVASTVARQLAPFVQGMTEAVKALGENRTKSDDIALIQEQQARKALEDAQARAAIQQQMATLETALKEAKDKLAELTGEQPRALQQGGYRASQASDTVPQTTALKEAYPVGFDPNFFSEFLGGKSNLLPPQ